MTRRTACGLLHCDISTRAGRPKAAASFTTRTHLILALDAAAGKRPYISVFGEDYPTSDGTAIRDYIHVSI